MQGEVDQGTWDSRRGRPTTFGQNEVVRVGLMVSSAGIRAMTLRCHMAFTTQESLAYVSKPKRKAESASSAMRVKQSAGRFHA
jgi:hypothetical protein